ncbi:MAG: chromophore lyase CpcT/CpeT [Cyanobacteria bacterium P01_H01_bin.15]
MHPSNIFPDFFSRIISCAAISALLETVAPLPPGFADSPPIVTDHPSVIADYLSGRLRADTGKVEVDMVTCVIAQPAETSSIYLYQEQYVRERKTQPYRQRLLRLVPDGERTQSKAHEFTEPNEFIGFCDRPQAERVIESSEFVAEPKCVLMLVPVAAGYQGETPPGGCPANLRGAVRITNTVILYENGMDTYDRGFDAAGQQVWGATDTPYRFQRVVEE